MAWTEAARKRSIEVRSAKAKAVNRTLSQRKMKYTQGFHGSSGGFDKLKPRGGGVSYAFGPKVAIDYALGKAKERKGVPTLNIVKLPTAAFKASRREKSRTDRYAGRAPQALQVLRSFPLLGQKNRKGGKSRSGLEIADALMRLRADRRVKRSKD